MTRSSAAAAVRLDTERNDSARALVRPSGRVSSEGEASGGERSGLESSGREYCVIAPGEYVYRQAEPRLCVYRVERGAIALFQWRRDWRSLNVQIAGPEDYIGLGCLGHYRDNARALVKSVVRPISRSECARLLERDPELRQKQNEAIERDFEYGKSVARSRGRENPVECVATFLIALSRQNAYEGRDRQVIIDTLDGSVVTSLLGIDESTLGYSLGELEAMDLVERYPPASLRIKNIAALERIANGGAPDRSADSWAGASTAEPHSSTSLLDRALASPAGARYLARAERRLLHELTRHRFNTEGAIHVFTASIDNAVWCYLRGNPQARNAYRRHRRTLARRQKGVQLARAFIERSGASDQRRTRFWLKFVLGP